MKLFNIFNEDWQTVRGYDRERYTELPGLEGPISTKSGKVLYYDKKEGKYYDRDTDMYLDHDEALAFLNEDFEAEFGFPLVEKDDIASTGKTQRILTLMRAKYPQAENDIEALLLHFDAGQTRDRLDINRLGAENDAEEEEIDALQKELDKIKARRGIGEAEGNKERAERAAMAKIQDQFKDMPKYKPQSAEERAKAHKEREAQAMEKAKQQANMLMQLADKHGESISASEVGYFAMGIADGKRGYSDPKAGDAYGPNVYAYDAGVRVGEKLGESVNEDYYETDEQRKLARLGRIIMDMGAKRDDDVGAAMGAVGNELTKYGTPQGVSTIKKLEQVTGQPESVIMKMMALAQQVQGDVAVGDDVPDEEIEEADFDSNFKKRIGYTVRGGAASDMMKKQAAQAQQMNRELDPGAAEKGLGIGVLDVAKARKKAKEKGVRAPSNLRSSPNTRNPKRLPEVSVVPSKDGKSLVPMKKQPEPEAKPVPNSQFGLPRLAKTDKDRDIKIGDTVETLKMGQMQGTVTGFSKKGGIDKVMFKHKSGKVYATVPENLKVVGSKKTESIAEDKAQRVRDAITKGMDAWEQKYAQEFKPGDQRRFVSPKGRATDDIAKTLVGIDPNGIAIVHPTYDKEGTMVKKLAAYGGMPGLRTRPATQAELQGMQEQEVVEAKKKPVPTDPSKWSYYKSQAKKKFDVYPSAYANAWAAKQYKAAGGGWRMGKPKK